MPEEKHEEITDDVQNLVIARLDIVPPDKMISIGSAGEFTKEQLIEEVKKKSEIGKEIVDIELAFLRSLKDGSFLEAINS
jgi:hypothetical protein